MPGNNEGLTIAARKSRIASPPDQEDDSSWLLFIIPKGGDWSKYTNPHEKAQPDNPSVVGELWLRFFLTHPAVAVNIFRA